MYRGYKLEKISFGKNFDYYYEIGYAQYEKIENEVRNKLDLFLNEENSLDGKKIIDSWFPKIKTDIFLSHSHDDKNEVIAFAGWLKYCFNLTVFIDSCVWGYGNDLCKMLDDEFSPSKTQKGNYDYEKVLFSSSHVHMMLSSALASMIDKTECIIFYDTPNTTKIFNDENITESPWIYSEILFTEIVRKTIPKRVERLKKGFTNEGIGSLQGDPDALNIIYPLHTNHLIEIDYKLLNKWKKFNDLSGNKALDKLYILTTNIVDNGRR